MKTESPIEYPRPTLLCASFAAMKLLAAGKSEAAEDTLAEAFGNIIHRCRDKDGKFLMKMTLPIQCNDQELARAKAFALAVAESRLEESRTPPTP